MGIRTRNLFLLVIGCFMLCHTLCSSMQTFLRQGETLQYPDRLLSKSRKFLLRFFNPIDENRQNKNVFLGLFYNTKISSSPECQWVADRNAQDLDGSANLTLGVDGSLKISYEGGRSFVLYSSQAPSNSSVVLQDDGNLVLREFSSDGSSNQDLWQSFDHPTDTLLPGMKLGFNNKFEKNLTLVSQRDEGDDYRLGSYTLGVDPTKMNQLVIWWLGDIYWTSGPWENGNFTSASTLSSNEKLNFDFVLNKNGTYFIFSTFGDLFNPRLTLHDSGELTLRTNDDPTEPTDVLVNCNSNYYRDEGCVNKLPECSERQIYNYSTRRGIMSRRGTKMGKNLTLDDCGRKCYNNCSCAAFASVNNTDCVIWSRESTFRETSVLDGGHLINTLTFRSDFRDRQLVWWTWLVSIFGGAGFVIMIGWCSKRCKTRVETRRQKMLLQEIGVDALPPSTKWKKEQKTQRELRIFNFKNIVSATDNFSDENRLGKGGYGPVYKGRLPDGQEIAVKRLSSSSGQGLLEFKNEAQLVSELQHTNLIPQEKRH